MHRSTRLKLLLLNVVFASYYILSGTAFLSVDSPTALKRRLKCIRARCINGSSRSGSSSGIRRSGGEGIEYITFVSSNKLKIEEVKSILGSEFPFRLRFEGLDLEEPQATPIEISQAKCRNACEIVTGPVMVEDTSLCFNALNGLPGQYIKWFYEALGNEGLDKLLAGFTDRSAYAECVLSFSLGKGFPVKTFVGIAEGKTLFHRC